MRNIDLQFQISKSHQSTEIIDNKVVIVSFVDHSGADELFIYANLGITGYGKRLSGGLGSRSLYPI